MENHWFYKVFHVLVAPRLGAENMKNHIKPMVFHCFYLPRFDENGIVFSIIGIKTNEITRISPLRAIEKIEKIDKIDTPPALDLGLVWHGLASLALVWSGLGLT